MSADLLTRLIEAGTPAALVAEVAMLAAEVARVDQRVSEAVSAATVPTAGALRTRAWRERHAASHTVTCDASDAHVTPTVTEAPSPDKAPQTPKINPTPHVCGDGPAREAPSRRVTPFPCPANCDPNDWRDLLANRKTKRLPLTAAAYRKLLRDLADVTDDEWPPGRVLAFAAERGWAAIFDPRQSEHRNGQRTHHNGHSARAGNPRSHEMDDVFRDLGVG